MSGGQYSKEMAQISAGYAAFFAGEPEPDRRLRTKAFRAGWRLGWETANKKSMLPVGNRVRRRMPSHVE
jgi:hypothetical protein